MGNNRFIEASQGVLSTEEVDMYFIRDRFDEYPLFSQLNNSADFMRTVYGVASPVPGETRVCVEFKYGIVKFLFRWPLADVSPDGLTYRCGVRLGGSAEIPVHFGHPLPNIINPEP